MDWHLVVYCQKFNLFMSCRTYVWVWMNKQSSLDTKWPVVKILVTFRYGNDTNVTKVYQHTHISFMWLNICWTRMNHTSSYTNLYYIWMQKTYILYSIDFISFFVMFHFCVWQYLFVRKYPQNVLYVNKSYFDCKLIIW